MPSDTGWLLDSRLGMVFLLKMYTVRVSTVSVLSSQGFPFLSVRKLVLDTAFCLCPLQKSRKAHPAKQSRRPWAGCMLLLRAVHVARYTSCHGNALHVVCG